MRTLFHPESSLFDQIHDAVIVTDLNGLVTNCNIATSAIYGYSKEELTGQSVAILYPESELPKMESLIAEVHSTGRADAELLNVTRDGREIWIQLSVSLLRDEAGEPSGMIGFSIDVTKTRLQQMADWKIAELLKSATAAAGVGTWHWDLKTNQLTWDEQSDRLLDTGGEEKRSFETFIGRVHPDDRLWIQEILARSLRGEEDYSAEYRVVHRDGSIHWLHGMGRTLLDEDGRPTRMLGVASDITDRKSGDKEGAKHGRYDALYHSNYIGVVTGNLEKIIDVNQAYCNMVGYSREELVSGSLRWQDITPLEYLQRDYEALDQLIRDGVCTPFEKEYICKDGSRVRVLLGASLLSRDPVQWSCFVVNVTQRHRDMMQLVASEQLASAAKMGSALAHEINNPLASLTNLIYLLRSDRNNLDTDGLLREADNALLRVSRITRQIIGLYSDSQRISPVPLAQVIEDTVTSYRSRMAAKDVAYEERNDIGQAEIMAVESDLRRVLSSVLENAVDAVSPGGTIRCHLTQSKDWRTSGKDGVRIVIHDNGPGIPKDIQERVFEPFFSTKTERARGLGLWVTRSIIEKSGGSLRMRTSTRPGYSGTIFSIFLPQESRAAKSAR